jgi:hypothetical protein
MLKLQKCFLLFLLICSTSANAQYALDNYRINPIREKEVLTMKALKVKMRRTLEIKDTINWKPTVCDYWDTTYYTYLGKNIRSLFIGYNPISINDQYNVHSCTEDPTPSAGYPFDYVMTHRDSINAQEAAREPIIMWPVPSDSIISTYNSDGYLISRINKIHSGSSKPRAIYYYFDKQGRCISEAKYNFFGLDDSTHLFFDSSGKLIQWEKVNQSSVSKGGVNRYNSHFVWDTTKTRFEYDPHGNCTDVYQASIAQKVYDDTGKIIAHSTYKGYHISQSFDGFGRITGHITYNNEGKPDTAQRWTYLDSGDVHKQYATAPWIKKPKLEIDSDLYDIHHEKKIGVAHDRFDDGRKTRETLINGVIVSRVHSTVKRGTVERKYSLEADSLGNVLRESTFYVVGNYTPASEILEYRYDGKGLKTDAYFTYKNSKIPPTKINRHLHYIYTYQK